MNTLTNDEVATFAEECKSISVDGVDDCLKMIKFHALLDKKYGEILDVSRRLNYPENLEKILQTISDQKMHNFKIMLDFMGKQTQNIKQIACEVLQITEPSQHYVLNDLFILLWDSSLQFRNLGTPQIPMYRISGEGMSTNSELYLAGSNHLGTPETKEFFVHLEPIYNRCQTVVFETDPDQVEEIQRVLAEHPDVIDAIRQSTAAVCWLADNTPIHSKWGVEATLKAQENFGSKKISYLETISDQVRAMASRTKKISLNNLPFIHKNIIEIMGRLTEVDSMKRVYYPLSGKDPLENLRSAIAAFDPPFYRKMYSEREEKWVPQIEQLMGQEGSHLIVVGAMHLAGEDSLVGVLRARGYRVEPVIQNS